MSADRLAVDLRVFLACLCAVIFFLLILRPNVVWIWGCVAASAPSWRDHRKDATRIIDSRVCVQDSRTKWGYIKRVQGDHGVQLLVRDLRTHLPTLQTDQTWLRSIESSICRSFPLPMLKISQLSLWIISNTSGEQVICCSFAKRRHMLGKRALRGIHWDKLCLNSKRFALPIVSCRLD